jgi:sugar lactone lactonase YvrE
VNTGSVAITAAGTIHVNPGDVATVAGDGTAGGPTNGPGVIAIDTSLDNPHGVALDSIGDIYIADTNNCEIRIVRYFRGSIELVVGDSKGVCGGGTMVDLPRGIAVTGSSSPFTLYGADTANERMLKVANFTPGFGGTLSTIAGTGTAGFSGDNGLATDAKLNNPNGVAVDGSSNVYIADTDNNRIRVIGH